MRLINYARQPGFDYLSVPSLVRVLPAPPRIRQISPVFLPTDKELTFLGFVPPYEAKSVVETAILVSDLANSALRLCPRN
jgi:hypothetical protein